MAKAGQPHQVRCKSITNSAQFTPGVVTWATTGFVSACAIRSQIVMSQFSSTWGAADKDGEWVKFWVKVQSGKEPGAGLGFPLAAEPPRLGLRGTGTSTLAVYVTLVFGWCSSVLYFTGLVAQTLKATAVWTLLCFSLQACAYCKGYIAAGRSLQLISQEKNRWWWVPANNSINLNKTG